MASSALRIATPSDAPTLAELHTTARRISMPYLPRLHTDEETHRWMSGVVIPTMEVWVAEEKGKISGYIAVAHDIVDQLYVAPQRHHRKVGSRLLEKAKELRPEGLRLHCFTRNAPARAFYESRGFVPLSFTDGERNEERLPDVMYEWKKPA